MNPIRDFAQMTAHLQSLSHRKRVVVVCPNDPHTEYAVSRALEEGIADFVLVADARFAAHAEEMRSRCPEHVDVLVVATPDEAAALAVKIVREQKADILMKGLINTDNLLRAVLNKETGILPKGEVLTHVAVAHVPTYPKLLIFSDAAVIPRPTLAQFKAMIRYAVGVAHCWGVEEPRIALLHCSEKINEKFPRCHTAQQSFRRIQCKCTGYDHQNHIAFFYHIIVRIQKGYPCFFRLIFYNISLFRMILHHIISINFF